MTDTKKEPVEELDSLLASLPEKEKELLVRYRKIIPVDVLGLCGALGIRVKTADDMPEGISGCILKVKGEYRIYCNAKEPETRRRFTVAHELAHFFLHKKQLEDEYGGDYLENLLLRGGLPSEQETEANKVAADILMPYPAIYKRIEEADDGFSFAQLAQKFGVSSQAMSIRLGIPLDI